MKASKQQKSVQNLTRHETPCETLAAGVETLTNLQDTIDIDRSASQLSSVTNN